VSLSSDLFLCLIHTPHRYKEGKTALVEKSFDLTTSHKGDLKSVLISLGYFFLTPPSLRFRVDREIEIKTRVTCVSCRCEATLWCIECKFSYCSTCWNAVPHHQFVHPDEVWRNRLPKNSIEKFEHSVTGLQVHITPQGIVSQGLIQKKQQNKLSSHRHPLNTSPPHQSQHRSSSPTSPISRHGGGERKSGGGGREFGHRLSNFPSTDSIMERGFNHAENWADLEDETSFTSEGGSGGGKRTGKQKGGERSDLKIQLPAEYEQKGLGGDGDLIPVPSEEETERSRFDQPLSPASARPPSFGQQITDDNSCDGDEVQQVSGSQETRKEGEEEEDDDSPTPSSLLQSTELPPSSSNHPFKKSYLPPRQEQARDSSTREPPPRAQSPKHLIWQVSPTTTTMTTGGTLTTVNRMKVSPSLRQMRGITYQFSTPPEWTGGEGKGGRTGGVERSEETSIAGLEFTIHRGVSVATIRR
jgi:hypothetical protein